jgi:heme/copper-type cytochrome/quinol oxidase subunit 2
MTKPITFVAIFSLACLGGLPLAHADDATAPVTLTLENHHFSPAEITIPANTRVEFDVTNQDATPAEFESDDFSAEKVLPAGQPVKVTVGPLKPGTYEFHDEYNEDASKSRLIVE